MKAILGVLSVFLCFVGSGQVQLTSCVIYAMGVSASIGLKFSGEVEVFINLLRDAGFVVNSMFCARVL